MNLRYDIERATTAKKKIAVIVCNIIFWGSLACIGASFAVLVCLILMFE